MSRTEKVAEVKPPVRFSSLHHAGLLSVDRPHTSSSQRNSSRKPPRPATAPVPGAKRELIWLTSSSPLAPDSSPPNPEPPTPTRTDHLMPMQTLIEDETAVQGTLNHEAASLGATAGPIDSFTTTLGEKTTLTGNTEYDWDTFITAYGAGRWDPNKTPNRPRPCVDINPDSYRFPSLEKLETKECESFEETTPSDSDMSLVTAEPQPVESFPPLFLTSAKPPTSGPRAHPTRLPPRVSQPSHHFRKYFASSTAVPTPNQTTASAAAAAADIRATVATMRWAAAHVDISPLALPSPEHEFTDPMRGVTAAIPGSHPHEFNFVDEYPKTPGGTRRTRLSGFWEGTTDIDDSILNHTVSRMPFSTSMGTVDSATDPNNVDNDQESPLEGSVDSNATQPLMMHPASAPLVTTRHTNSLGDTADYFGELSLSPKNELPKLSFDRVLSPPPSLDRYRSENIPLDLVSNSVPAPTRPPYVNRPGSSPLPSSSSPNKPLISEGHVRSESMATLKHIRAVKEENMFTELQYLTPPYSPEEADRRRALYKFNLWNTGADINFDRIAHLVKLVFSTKGVIISLIDEKEQWFKSEWGMKTPSCLRAHSFCGHAILQRGDEPMVVLDSSKDWRFAKNPLATQFPHVRFYAGAPLRTQDGFNIGTLAIIDDQPREEFSPRQRHTLKEFAAITMREMELWRDKIQLRVRDRIQNSMEEFSRECLEIDEDAYEKAESNPPQPPTEAPMEKVYDRAAKLVKGTLDVEGVIVMDLFNCEVPEKLRDEGNISVTLHHGDPDKDQTTVRLTTTEYQDLNDFFEKFPQGKISEGIIPQSFKPFLPVHIQYALIVPIFNIDKRPFALLCAYNTQNHQQRFLEGHELSYLRAIGVIILSAVLKKRMLEADKAKNLFISNISHELRTPLHGILAAAELLSDSNLNHPQTSLMQTVKACGTSLIETVNHVLDFTKLSGHRKSGGVGRVIAPTTIDLMQLVEEAVDGCWIGHHAWVHSTDSVIGSVYSPPKGEQGLPTVKRVETVINVGHRAQGWLLKCEKGGIRRVLMNLLGNSLKFTSDGYIHILLQEAAPKEGDPPDMIMVELIVCDTGKGIGQKFLKNQLFQPFSQENPLQTGTGLGLAIVSSIITSDNVRGEVDVWSEEGVGTKIKVTFPAEVPSPAEPDPALLHLTNEPLPTVSLYGFSDKHQGTELLRIITSQYITTWWGLSIVDDGDIVILNDDPSPIALAIERNDPKRCFILFSSAHGNTAIMTAATEYDKIGGFCRILYKPGGPSRLHAVIQQCADYLHPRPIISGSPLPHTPDADQIHLLPEVSELDSVPTVALITGGTLLQSSLGSLGGAPHFRVLVVEDNNILRDLLIKWLVKKKYDFAFAVNGREGVKKFQNEGPFSIILLDMSMPVLDGIGATKEIRQIEADLQKKSPDFRKTKLLALTGMSSLEDKRRAFIAGVDGYIVKPVAFVALDEMFHKLGVLPASPQ